MTQLRSTVLLGLGLLALPGTILAQEKTEAAWEVVPLTEKGQTEYHFDTGLWTATNGVLVKYAGAVLTADQASIDVNTGNVDADGHVRVQQGEQIWVAEHMRYNFKTHQMEAAQFRTGQAPMFAAGSGLHGDISNRVYYATNATLTTDDVGKPAVRVVAKRIKIIPGKKMQAYNGVLYIGEVPVFYFPYYERSLGRNANNFNFVPGYRSLYGPYVLGSYTWFMDTNLDGIVHLDYRQKRGPGAGPDVNFHLGPWGEGSVAYYYTHDQDPNIDQLGVPIPENRQRLYMGYQANPATNLYLKALVDYQSDLAVDRDFFPGAYLLNPQPKTFIEANQFWQNFSLDAYVQPRVDSFLETVERLPDVRLTGFRQEIGDSPLYYESQSSMGYYQRLFAENTGFLGPPPGLNYAAARADTYHQVLLPETFFGWLNVTPRVGGRFTSYSEASGPGGTTDEQNRGVFNTGAEVSFKASRLWPEVQSGLFQVDGLRHIIEPSADYVFVPSPTVAPQLLPQFDYELPSLRLLPIDFPDDNNIDSIDSQNVIRWGLRNKLQTKRENQVVNVLDWALYTDWRLQPQTNQTTFADLYSDLTLRPRSWLSLESLTRYGINDGFWRMSYTTLTITPSSVWSWRVGHYYLRDDLAPSPTALGLGNNVLTSAIDFRLNENWAFRTTQYFEARTGQLLQHSYTLYRDMRSWTAALTFLASYNVFGPEDYTVAFTFSLKAYPHYGLGRDLAGPFSLLGGG